MTRPYLVELQPSDEGGWWAKVPDLPIGLAFGACQAEAANNVADAAEDWIKSQRHRGASIPEPKATPKTASTKITWPLYLEC